MTVSNEAELEGQTIVIKGSGKFFEDPQYREWLAEDVAFFHEQRAKEAIVYGGQERITNELIAAKIDPKSDDDGIRIIKTKRGAEAVTKVMDEIGHEFEDSVKRYTDRCHLFLRAIHAARFKYDFVGYPKKISDQVKRSMERGYIAIVSPIGILLTNILIIM